jgi:hypothetical protein
VKVIVASLKSGSSSPTLPSGDTAKAFADEDPIFQELGLTYSVALTSTREDIRDKFRTILNSFYNSSIIVHRQSLELCAPPSKLRLYHSLASKEDDSTEEDVMKSNIPDLFPDSEAFQDFDRNSESMIRRKNELYDHVIAHLSYRICKLIFFGVRTLVLLEEDERAKEGEELKILEISQLMTAKGLINFLLVYCRFLTTFSLPSL